MESRSFFFEAHLDTVGCCFLNPVVQLHGKKLVKLKVFFSFQ